MDFTVPDQYHNHAAAPRQHPPADRSSQQARDPICGMAVDTATAKHRHVYEGSTYYFCSAPCLAKFRDEFQLRIRH